MNHHNLTGLEIHPMAAKNAHRHAGSTRPPRVLVFWGAPGHGGNGRECDAGADGSIGDARSGGDAPGIGEGGVPVEAGGGAAGQGGTACERFSGAMGSSGTTGSAAAQDRVRLVLRNGGNLCVGTGGSRAARALRLGRERTPVRLRSRSGSVEPVDRVGHVALVAPWFRPADHTPGVSSRRLSPSTGAYQCRSETTWQGK